MQVMQEIARRNASQAALAGEQKVAVEQMKTRQQVGAIKAQQAASGVDVDSGSRLMYVVAQQN